MMKTGTLKGYVLLVFFFFFMILSAAAVKAESEREGDPKYIFYKANTLYEEGKYDEAISEYSKLFLQGIESGNLYYNLGNSYFKKGELGMAVLNYERAKRLVPRDSDLKSNYRFALSRMKSNLSETSRPWFKKAAAVFDTLTINEMTVMLSSVFVVIILFFIVRLYVNISGRNSLIFVSLSVVVFGIVAFSLFSRISILDREAVVVSESAEVRFEPFENATTHFTLYEGIKIEIVHSRKEWMKVRRPDGKIGWIKSQAAEKI
ncbi:MAG: hypothetical protein ABFR82_06325 [Nitrospirota bacterium]